MAGDDDGSSLITKLVICLIAAASAAVIVTVYHCITTGHILKILLRRPAGRTSVPQPLPPHHHEQEDETQLQNSTTTSVENSLAELIPCHKYQKTGGGGGGLVGHDHDGMCAVCLSDFEEGEMLRTLPECMHSYHAPCIDMWLYSHSNCPMCRYTVAAPSTSTSPQMLLHFLESVTNLESPPSLPRPPPLPLQQNMPATRHNFRV